MPTLLDFRRRIRSVKNTQQITRAMKFIAATKLRRTQEGVFSARPYSRQILKVLISAASRMENPQHPLLVKREEQRILAVVFTGDKGLCGAFNTNVIRRALEFFKEKKGASIEVIAVGKKARDVLRKRGWNIQADYVNVTSRVEYGQAKSIAQKVVDLYTAAQVDAVYCIFNEFKSVLSQRLTVSELLPLDPEILRVESAEGRRHGEAHGEQGTQESGLLRTGVNVDYIYEQPLQEILDRLLPRHVETQIFRVMLESAAAFNAAQMTAMDAATKNAAELIDKVTLNMNKVRQAGITKEIIEVISGAASAGM